MIGSEDAVLGVCRGISNSSCKGKGEHFRLEEMVLADIGRKVLIELRSKREATVWRVHCNVDVDNDVQDVNVETAGPRTLYCNTLQ